MVLLWVSLHFLSGFKYHFLISVVTFDLTPYTDQDWMMGSGDGHEEAAERQSGLAKFLDRMKFWKSRAKKEEKKDPDEMERVRLAAEIDASLNGSEEEEKNKKKCQTVCQKRDAKKRKEKRCFKSNLFLLNSGTLEINT